MSAASDPEYDLCAVKGCDRTPVTVVSALIPATFPTGDAWVSVEAPFCPNHRNPVTMAGPGDRFHLRPGTPAPRPGRVAGPSATVTPAPGPGPARVMSPDGSRGAVVYLCAGTDSTYRIRAEKYPEHSDPGANGGHWYGGRVLWGHDQPTMSAALDLADRWVTHGTLPPAPGPGCRCAGLTHARTCPRWELPY